jgi:tRNA(adenine34) deaminase
MTEFMNQANKLAKLAFKNNEVPIGCVIVYDGIVIASGYNNRESNSDILGHAELIAIKKASQLLCTWKLDDCQMYVTVEPCLMCYGAILQSRIKKVYIGSYQDKLKKTSFRHYLNDTDIIDESYINQESKTIMKSFFELLRKG